MNIYQKLIEVRKTVPYLQKDEQGPQFKYVSSSQTLGALKSKMDELSLLLVPRILKATVQNHVPSKDTLIKGEVVSMKGTQQYFTVLDMLYTWINAEEPGEKIKCRWQGQGLDFGERGLGKALTYAEKYFMLKFFNIPTDKDDPDAFQNKIEGEGNGKKKDTKKPPLNDSPDKNKKVWPSKAAFIADIKEFEKRIGTEKYNEIAKLHQVKDGALNQLNKEQGLSLYQDLLTLYQTNAEKPVQVS